MNGTEGWGTGTPSTGPGAGLSETPGGSGTAGAVLSEKPGCGTAKGPKAAYILVKTAPSALVKVSLVMSEQVVKQMSWGQQQWRFSDLRSCRSYKVCDGLKHCYVFKKANSATM